MEGHACFTNGCESLDLLVHDEFTSRMCAAVQVATYSRDRWLIEEHKHSGVTVYTKAGYAAMRDNVGIGSPLVKKLSDLLMRQDEHVLMQPFDAWCSRRRHQTSRVKNGAVPAGADG